MMPNRVILLVIDACGVGELPDAAEYGDRGASTIPNIAAVTGGLNLPTCTRLGLGNITPIRGVPAQQQPAACFGRMAEKSPGKDSTTGHWEIAGVALAKPFPLFPNGFPESLVSLFEQKAGIKTVGNIAASGTEIIKRLGAHHLKTREIILYTSADSVFQLAAHEDLYPLERQYQICRIARNILTGDHAVARVIARPFAGEAGDFTRTAGRRDFSLEPPSETILDLALKNNLKTLAIGKIYDLYAERGFSSRIKTKSNEEVMDALTETATNDTEHRLIFANCVDFDMLWGHRNDTEGFATGLEQFDIRLKDLLARLRDDDLLIVTADHGCDPTIKRSTDHTREYVPLLVYGRTITPGIDLGTRETFADIACTLGEIFGIKHEFDGRSFLNDIAR